MEIFESIDQLIGKISDGFPKLKFVKSNERAFLVEGEGFKWMFAYSELPDGRKTFSSAYDAADGYESVAMDTMDAIMDRID